MTVVLNQASVRTEFNRVIPAEVAQYLLAMIVGPQGELHLYSDSTEKVNIAVGPYNNATPTSYGWPDKEPTSLVNLNSVGIFIDNALLNYFTHATGGGSTITVVGGFSNRIVTNAADGFKANGVTYPRDPSLGDRDVQVGDVVHLRYSGNDFYSTVNALIPDVIPATIGSASPDAANPSTQGASSSVVQTAGTVNDVGATESATSYEGEPSGFINETYTVVVTQAS